MLGLFILSRAAHFERLSSFRWDFGCKVGSSLARPRTLKSQHRGHYGPPLAAWTRHPYNGALMTTPQTSPPLSPEASIQDARYPHRHLLEIEGLSRPDIEALLDLSETYVEQNRRADKKASSLRGRTLINLFFENSTRTRTSFELAGKRLGGDVINMSVGTSSVKKGESLIDTAMTLNAMHPDALVVRHGESGAVHLLAQKVNCAVVNAGDGSHEHPTQALLDALAIRRRLGHLEGLDVAICGDVAHSRVARSNIHLLSIMGAPRAGGGASDASSVRN